MALTKLRCIHGLWETTAAFHYAKISADFGSNVNGTVRPRWKFSGQSGPPPEVVLFDRSVRSDRKLQRRNILEVTHYPTINSVGLLVRTCIMVSTPRLPAVYRKASACRRRPPDIVRLRSFLIYGLLLIDL